MDISGVNVCVMIMLIAMISDDVFDHQLFLEMTWTTTALSLVAIWKRFVTHLVCVWVVNKARGAVWETNHCGVHPFGQRYLECQWNCCFRTISRGDLD